MHIARPAIPRLTKKPIISSKFHPRSDNPLSRETSPPPPATTPTLRSTPLAAATMSLLTNIIGFSIFGFAARVGQLGIQKRGLFESASPCCLCRTRFID